MPIRYGLIGSGMMGQEHIRNLKLLKDVTVTAISDPDEGMQQRSIETSGGSAQAFGDHKDLLQQTCAMPILLRRQMTCIMRS